jgi:hypothetical protein
MSAHKNCATIVRFFLKYLQLQEKIWKGARKLTGGVSPDEVPTQNVYRLQQVIGMQDIQNS